MKYLFVHGRPKESFVHRITVPSDKSISHRAIIFSSLALGKTIISNFLQAEDTLHTIQIFKDLGVKIEQKGELIEVTGVGLKGLKQASKVLDVGNSGTGIRLILGVLAGQLFESEITGDESIQTRPMKRVVNPLLQMGASFKVMDEQGMWVNAASREQITAPLQVKGSDNLQAINYCMPVSSAQVKSAILLAGLYAKGVTTISDPGMSRDHTERMLQHFGVSVVTEDNTITLSPGQELVSPGKLQVPVDISSAAFWLVLGTILPEAKITIPGVGINPTRIGIITVLREMGANIMLTNESQIKGEPVADITVSSSNLKAITIHGDIIPTLIDEIPIIAVAAAFAQGKTIIKEAKELRVKESDRIKTTCNLLREFGANVEELEDGLIIEGQCSLHPAQIHSSKDHRIAMSAAIMSLAIQGESSIIDVGCIKTSYPDFLNTLQLISKGVKVL